MKLSNSVYKILESPVKKLIPYVIKAKSRGIKIYHLNIGDSDVKTPQILLNNLNRWKKNPISYVGVKEENILKKAIINYYKKIKISNLALNNIQFTSGASEGLLWTLLSIINPGDEIIVIEPFFPTYEVFATITKAKIRTLETNIETQFKIKNIKILEKLINKKTKAILICNPSNPTGLLLDNSQIKDIINIAKKKNIFIISDEVYRDYYYEGNLPKSFLNFTEDYNNGIVVIDSLSKRYSLCGARIGMIITKNKELINTFYKYGQFRNPLSLIDCVIASNIINIPKAFLNKIRIKYKKRRDVLSNCLKNIPGIISYLPQGAFYLLVQLPICDSKHFCKWLLTDFQDHEETIMLTPANNFYKNKSKIKNQVRIAYVMNQKKIVRSMQILKKALNLYKAKFT